MLAVGVTALAVTFVAVLVGSATQSIVGFGMNLVAVPAALLVGADDLVPGALIVALTVQAATLAVGEGNRADWRLLGWFLPVRVVGTAAGVAAVSSLSGDTTILVICALVLLAIGTSARGWRVPLRPGSYMAAGFASGFSNVISSIGGPPLAIVLTDHDPPAQRSTQGWSAMLGSVMSITMLAAVGRFGLADVGRGLVLIPAALAGSVVVRPIRHRLPTAASLRPWVYAVAVLGCVTVAIRTLVT